MQLPRLVSRLLFITLLFAWLSSAAQYEVAFSQTYPRRYKTIDSIADALHFYVDSSTAFKAYEHIRKLARKHQDDKAVLLADKLEFFYRATPITLSSSPAGIEAKAKLLIRRAQQLDFPAMEASVRYGLGIYYFDHAANYALAFEQFLTAYDIFNKLSVEEFPDKGFYLYEYASRCYKFGDYKHAIKYCNEADKYGYRNYITQVYSLNVLGMAYYRCGDYDSARYVFERVYQTTPLLLKESYKPFYYIWRGIAQGNIGNTWYGQGQYDKALPYLEQGLDTTVKWEIWDNVTGFALKLADIYLSKNEPEKALFYINHARKAAYKTGNDEDYYQLYHLLADYYKNMGNAQLALVYTDSSIWWKEQWTKRLDVNKKTNAELLYAEEKFAKDEAVLQREIHAQRIVRNSLLALIVISALLALVLVKRKQEKIKRKEERLKMEVSHAEQKLMHAQESIERFTQDIHEKNEIIGTLEKLQFSQPVIPADQTDLLEKLRTSVILDDEGWRRFRENFEIVYPGYLEYIRKNYPGCTASEYRLILLEKLQLSNKEMASMLGVSTETIRSTRSRLRKKIGDGFDNLIKSV